jgi:hypothetical protein
MENEEMRSGLKLFNKEFYIKYEARGMKYEV